jgi:MFS family permease
MNDSVGSVAEPARRKELACAPTSWRGLQLFLVTVAAAAAAFGRTAVSPLQETMRVALGLSDNQIALLQGPALALPVVIAAVPLGWVIDRYSRIRLILILTLLDAVGTFLTAFASNFVLLFLARCLVGLTATAVATAAFSLLSDLCSPGQRGRATMMVVIGQTAGISGAFALGGLLLSTADSGSSAWRWAVLWLTAPLVLVIFSTFALREPPRAESAIVRPSARETWLELWRCRWIIAPLLAGLVMAEIALQATLVWAAPTLSRNLGMAPARIGAIMATGLLVSGILGPVAGGTLADLCQSRSGPRRTMSLLSALQFLIAPTCLFAISSRSWLASALLIVFMTTIDALLVMGTTLFTIVIPNELRGLCMAVFSAGGVLFGVGLSPVIVSMLSNKIGGPSMIGKALALVCITTSLLSGIIFALGRHHFPRSATR